MSAKTIFLKKVTFSFQGLGCERITWGGYYSPHRMVSLAFHNSPLWARSECWAPGSWLVPASFLLCAPPSLCFTMGPAPFRTVPRKLSVSPRPPRPTFLHCVHRFAGHRSRSGKEKADFWAKLYTSKEAKNLPAAGVGGTTRCDADHSGNRSHHLPGAVLLPPTWREQ